MALIICKNLCIGYDGKEIIHNLNFDIKDGEFLCVVGENGSGKTTLMKTLLGLQQPISGCVLTGDDLKQNEIGYLPQQTIIQKGFPATVWEIVLSGSQGQCGLRPYYTKQEKKKAKDSIEKMGISDLMNKCYRELSGGQQQRVLLARALCATKKMLLLDEPVSSLDPKATAEMYKLIEKINKDGVAIIMISHDIDNAITYADHILHIGNTIFYGTRDKYLLSDIQKGLNIKGDTL